MDSFFGFRIGVFWGLGFVVIPRPDWFVAKSRHEIFELGGLGFTGPARPHVLFVRFHVCVAWLGSLGEGRSSILKFFRCTRCLSAIP